MKEQLLALKRREITFDQFARATTHDWDRLAGYVWERWRRKVPVGVSLEDIRQELLVAAWVAVGRWRPGKGPGVKSFVVWNACAWAIRWVNMQRNALRRADHAESRCPVPFAALGEDAHVWLEGLGGLLQGEAEDQTLDDLLDAKDAFMARLEAATAGAEGIRLWALAAFQLAGYDLGQAGALLYEERDLRRWGHWGSPVDAAQQVAATLVECLAA